MIKVDSLRNIPYFCWQNIKNNYAIKKFKKTARWIVGILLSIYIGVILLLNIPYVQQQFSTFIAQELSQTLHSKLTIGRIDMGLLNRIIINDLLLNDQSGREMLKVSRLSVKLDLLSLFNGRISISNIQLFGFDINLSKQTPDGDANFQFVLDAFTPQDTLQQNKKLDIRINSLLIRRGKLSYDVFSEPQTPGKFNPSHMNLHNIIANISLKSLQNDSINAAIKRLSIEDTNSGFELKKISLKIIGNNHGMHIHNFKIGLPHTTLALDTILISYNKIDDLKYFTDKVHFSFHIQPSPISLSDLSAFIPAFTQFKESMLIETTVNGTINQLNFPQFILSASDNHFNIRGNVSLQDLSRPSDAYIYGSLSRLYADSEGISFLMRNLSNNSIVPPALHNIGTVLFQGDISGYFTDLVTYGQIHTDLGTIKTDVKLSTNNKKGTFSYSGSIKTQHFNLGKMLSNNKIGETSFNLLINGSHTPKQYPAIIMKGVISAITYSEYTYHNITLDGEYKQGGFIGKAALNDENGTIILNGTINTAAQIPTFNFFANIDRIRPHALKLTSEYPDTEISVKVRADFIGSSIDNMKGEINVDSLLYTTPATNHFMDNFKIVAKQIENGQNQLTFISTFLKGNIEGTYSYRTLPASILNIMQHYIPSLIQTEKKETKNNFHFNFHVYDTELFSSILNIPLKIYTHSNINGYFNDQTGRLRIEGYFPRLRYNDKFIESAMFICENPYNEFHANLRFTHRKEKSSINISMEAQAENDRINATLNWGNSGINTYSGKLATITHFFREEKSVKTLSKRKKKSLPHSALKTIINIQPTNVILNDTLWEISPSHIVIDSGKVHINNFYFSHQERYLHIDGTLSKQPEDTIRINLQKINIGYVFDIANLGVNFQGEATGPALASNVFDKPTMHTDLYVHNLGLNDALLGDANIHGEWHHDVKGIWLEANIQEKDTAHTHVKGYIYPIKPTSALDLQIEARNTNLKFIHYYMNSITPEFAGRATGYIHFYGKFKALSMQGRVIGNASMKVDVLNTTFSIQDSIYIEPEGLTFKNNRIYDSQGHQGTMNGYLHYQHFKHLQYHFDFNVNNMLVMNTQESTEYPFYGTVYGTGNATIAGNERDGVNINVAMTTNRNTVFTYIKDNVSSAVSNQFIKFIDKTPRRILQDTLLLSDFERARQEFETEQSDTDIKLNLIIDATPDAIMKIIMDPAAGDYISGRGTGNIRTEFYNKGDVKMFGNYHISQGIYKFSLQEVIRKDFIIKEGSNISFNGSPLNAILDINASYTVNSVSLNDLIPSSSVLGTEQTNVKVNCLMSLSGQLTSPNIKMDLEFPNERDEVQTLVHSYISTDEEMNMQILYLLGIGKFYAPENIGGTQNSNMMSSVLSSTLSGQLSNALSNIIDNNNWNIGTNLSTGERGWTDVEFEGMLSGQLLNNRLLINGNFGYRDNPLSNTNFVGDFEAEWLVNRSGTIRLKAYNETNDRYYTRTNLTTQGIGIIFKKDFNKWNELLFWNKWKLKQLNKKREKTPK